MPLHLAPYSKQNLTDGNFLEMQPSRGGWIVSSYGEYMGFIKKTKAGWRQEMHYTGGRFQEAIDKAERILDEHLSGAKENPLTARAAWTIGLLAAAGAIIGGYAYFQSHKSSSPTTQPVRVPPKYITGHRYRVRVTGAPVAQINPASVTVANAQAKIDQQAPGVVKVFSATLTGTTLSITVDYIGTTQDSATISKQMTDQITANGITLSDVTVTVADEGFPEVGGPSNATDADAVWHAWKQTYDGDDAAVDVYVGPSESNAATAAAYYANQGFRTGYYSALQ